MKTLKRIMTASIVATTLGLSGCDAVNEGYEIGMATVEFVETQKSLATTILNFEQQLDSTQGMQELIGAHQNLIEQLNAQLRNIGEGDGSQMLKLMSTFLVEDVVMMFENNLMVLNHMAPMNMTIKERFLAVSSEQDYLLHKEKLLALQQATNDISSHIDGDIQSILSKIEQSELNSELQLLLVEAIRSFNSDFKQSIVEQLENLPQTVAEEIKWIDYVYEFKSVISVDENDQLIFDSPEDLNHYNTFFDKH